MHRRKTLSLAIVASALLACQLQSLFPTATPTTAPRTRTPTPIRAEPTPEPAAQPAIPPTEPPPPPAPVTATTTENLRVRAAPSTAAQQIGSLTKGQTVQVIGRTAASDWWQIALPTNPTARGWIAASFTTLSGSVDSIPVVTPGASPPPAQPPPLPPPVAQPTLPPPPGYPYP